MFMIVLTIKSYFFIDIDNYHLGQKSNRSYFFQLFYREIIGVIYTMLAIAIKVLEIQTDNLNLLLRNNVIWFEPLTKNREIGK